MTIGGWFLYIFLAVCVATIGIIVGLSVGSNNTWTNVLIGAVCVALIVALFFVFNWYYHNTASGIRSMNDQKSDLQNGLKRTVTIYTASGDIIAQYTGKIDIEDNKSGCIKFDFEGKRYIYYNCFVETIAELQ